MFYDINKFTIFDKNLKLEKLIKKVNFVKYKRKVV